MLRRLHGDQSKVPFRIAQGVFDILPAVYYAVFPYRVVKRAFRSLP